MKPLNTNIIYENPLPQLNRKQSAFSSVCELNDGKIIASFAIGEAFESVDSKTYIAISTDGGKTFSAPKSTGVMGQASFVLSLGGEKLLAIHSLRRDTERPGIYGYIVDFSDREWKIESEALLWEPSMPITKDTKMAEIFSFLKFGQPSAILLKDGDVLMTHWFAEAGQYKTCTTRIKL